MRRIFQAVPILFALLLLDLGAFMPQLAALAVDQRLDNNVMLLENEDFSFALEQGTDFFQTLALFGGGHSQVELSEGYRMNVGDAAAAAVDVRMRLAIFDTAYESPEVTPMLITSRSTPGLSGVFWRCVWRDSMDTPDVLWLDDQSGQMVSFTGRVGQFTISASDTVFPQSAVNAAEYCRLNYPVDAVKLALTNEDDPDGRYTVALLKSQDGQDQTHLISARLVDGWLYFNT